MIGFMLDDKGRAEISDDGGRAPGLMSGEPSYYSLSFIYSSIALSVSPKNSSRPCFMKAARVQYFLITSML